MEDGEREPGATRGASVQDSLSTKDKNFRHEVVKKVAPTDEVGAKKRDTKEVIQDATLENQAVHATSTAIDEDTTVVPDFQERAKPTAEHDGGGGAEEEERKRGIRKRCSTPEEPQETATVGDLGYVCQRVEEIDRKEEYFTKVAEHESAVVAPRQGKADVEDRSTSIDGDRCPKQSTEDAHDKEILGAVVAETSKNNSIAEEAGYPVGNEQPPLPPPTTPATAVPGADADGHFSGENKLPSTSDRPNEAVAPSLPAIPLNAAASAVPPAADVDNGSGDVASKENANAPPPADDEGTEEDSETYHLASDCEDISNGGGGLHSTVNAAERKITVNAAETRGGNAHGAGEGRDKVRGGEKVGTDGGVDDDAAGGYESDAFDKEEEDYDEVEATAPATDTALEQAAGRLTQATPTDGINTIVHRGDVEEADSEDGWRVAGAFRALLASGPGGEASNRAVKELLQGKRGRQRSWQGVFLT